MCRELRELQIQCFIIAGKAEDIRSLVDVGVNLNLRTPDGTLLMLAAEKTQWHIVELLIDLGADPNNIHGDFEWKLIHFAAQKSWIRVVQLYVDKKFDLDVKSKKGETALMIASYWNNIPIVDLLVGGGVDINFCDCRGWSALHYAAYRGHLELVQYLVERKAAVNAQDSYGFTPLHLVLRKRQDIELICFLISAGTDVNLQDNGGTSVFNLVSKKELLGAVRLGIEKGGFVSFRDYLSLVSTPLIKSNVLQRKKYCSQAIFNKYNNKDLPDLYKLSVASDVLPPIEKMKIKEGSGIIDEIERTVDHALEKHGYCNLPDAQPLSLSMMCVNVFLRQARSATNARIDAEKARVASEAARARVAAEKAKVAAETEKARAAAERAKIAAERAKIAAEKARAAAERAKKKKRSEIAKAASEKAKEKRQAEKARVAAQKEREEKRAEKARVAAEEAKKKKQAAKSGPVKRTPGCVGSCNSGLERLASQDCPAKRLRKRK